MVWFRSYNVKWRWSGREKSEFYLSSRRSYSKRRMARSLTRSDTLHEIDVTNEHLLQYNTKFVYTALTLRLLECSSECWSDREWAEVPSKEWWKRRVLRITAERLIIFRYSDITPVLTSRRFEYYNSINWNSPNGDTRYWSRCARGEYATIITSNIIILEQWHNNCSLRKHQTKNH